MSESRNASWRTSSQVLARSVGDTTVLMDMSSEQYLSLNETAAFAWDELKGGADFDQLVERILAEFAVQRSDVEADVAALLKSLSELGLIVAELDQS